MTDRLLVFFNNDMRFEYQRRITAELPELEVDIAANLDEAAEKIRDADILLAFGAQIRRDIFVGADRLRWVQALGTGLDGITDMPGLRPEVLVTATRGIHGVPLSEMGLLMMLALSRDLPRSVRAQDRADWERWPARLLHGKTVGILGVGAISEIYAPLCKAFGMQVIGFSRTARPLPGFDRFEPREALERVAPELDFLVLLIPSTPETKGIVSRAVLRAMKPSACVINLARGAVVDEDAMVEALREGWIGGAGLDTFVQEPLPSDHALWRTPNTIITPHLAGLNVEYPAQASAQFCANYRLFRDGRGTEMGYLEERAPVV